MKKHYCIQSFRAKSVLMRCMKKIPLAMRCTLFMLFCLVGMTFANDSYAQKTMVSLALEDRTVDEVLTELEQGTEFVFFYNNKQVDVNRRVSVQVNNKTIFKVLNDMFKGTNIGYKVLDRNIILYDKAVGAEEVQATMQAITVKGTVADATGEPIIGASILVKGTSNGVITDIDGNFTLSNVAPTATLLVSYVGYKTQEIRVDGKTSFNIVLAEDAEVLDEVVVVGYGVQKKQSLTGAVTAITSETIQTTKSENLINNIQGIYTTKASPGWPVMMVDSYFEGQRIAALRCQESGLAMVNLYAKNVPAVFDIDPNYCDKLFLENSYFENVSGPAVVITNENNSNNQITFRNVYCKNVPVLAKYTRSNTDTKVAHKIYKVKSYDHGLQMDNLLDMPEYETLVEVEPIQKMPVAQRMDIPALPAMATWVNLRELGAKGDGETDDTKAIQEAIDKYDNIYVPQGWYRITETLKMKPNTKLIGLHPFGTQFRLNESTAAFSGFGGPKAMVESSEGGANMLVGIGINTGGYNYRAVGVKWMANADSYMNDVKFVGGHGGLWKPKPGVAEPRGWWERPVRISSPDNPVAASGMDLAWDNQYWSLWVTNNGGGTFKDIWTASTYATNGFYANNTSTPGRIYAMSIEHHVRNEVRFNKVSNWKVYCMQTEEESRESTDCQPIEMDDCKDVTFANLYMFRVIRVNEPYHSSVRIRNCENIAFLNLHNYSQIKYTNNIAVFDVNKDIDIRPWELSRLIVTGKEPHQQPLGNEIGKVNQLASDLEFAEGIARDSKGNIYFCDHRMRRIFKWSVETNSLSLLADFPWKPSNLAFDSEDNLLVLFRYDAQPGYLINGKPEEMPVMPDTKGTSFSGYGNSAYTMRVYSIDPENPEETIKLLPRVPMGQVKNVYKALYPSNRWRDFHDFNAVSVYVPEMCFLAPDGKTIIPHYFDLSRSSSLLEAYPGKPFYTSDEYDRRMVKMDVANDGTLSNLSYFVEQGEFGSAVDKEGNLYVADGEIYVFDKDGKKKGMIRVPERPSTLQFGGKDGNTLFVTGRSKFFGVRIK